MSMLQCLFVNKTNAYLLGSTHLPFVIRQVLFIVATMYTWFSVGWCYFQQTLITFKTHMSIKFRPPIDSQLMPKQKVMYLGGYTRVQFAVSGHVHLIKLFYDHC